MSRVEGKMSRVEGKCRGFKNVGIFFFFNKKKSKQTKQNKTKNTERKKIKLKQGVAPVPETRTTINLVYNKRAVPLRHRANSGKRQWN